MDIAPHFLQPAETAAAALAGALESIAFLLQANLERLQQHLTPPRQLLLSGGLSHSR
ncbi:MAG: hypothetical protein GWN58_39055, partial [Anaerolineae bacterium]|nr:hypothetical protein [Anaerolineae bacterium]